MVSGTVPGTLLAITGITSSTQGSHQPGKWGGDHRRQQRRNVDHLALRFLHSNNVRGLFQVPLTILWNSNPKSELGYREPHSYRADAATSVPKVTTPTTVAFGVFPRMARGSQLVDANRHAHEHRPVAAPDQSEWNHPGHGYAVQDRQHQQQHARGDQSFLGFGDAGRQPAP